MLRDRCLFLFRSRNDVLPHAVVLLDECDASLDVLGTTLVVKHMSGSSVPVASAVELVPEVQLRLQHGAEGALWLAAMQEEMDTDTSKWN